MLLMRWRRMVLTACRLVGPYWYAPWRSPLLRWRLETYGITDDGGRLLTAREITAAQFLAFTWTHRCPLRNFLRWAATLERS